MGHPLELGPYRGFGLDGLRVGPSRLRAGTRDDSTVVAASTVVRLHPLASWRLRGLVLDLDFEGVEADLRRNARGRIWELGPFRPGGQPPRLEIRFRLPRQGRVRFWGLTPSGQPLVVDGKGSALLRTHQRSLAFQAQVAVPGQPGQAQLVGDGNWQRNLWRVDVATAGFAAAPFQPLLPFKGRLGGEAAGRFRLQLDQGLPSCEGELTLKIAIKEESSFSLHSMKLQAPKEASALEVVAKVGSVTQVKDIRSLDDAFYQHSTVALAQLTDCKESYLTGNTLPATFLLRPASQRTPSERAQTSMPSSQTSSSSQG
jgi:hypothetical protein